MSESTQLTVLTTRNGLATTGVSNALVNRGLAELRTVHDSDSSSLETYLREIEGAPVLNAEDEKHLALEIETGDIDARDRMLFANLRLVPTIARKYLDRGRSFSELIEAGNHGLMVAVEGFDPNMITRFSLYAVYWIEQFIDAMLFRGDDLQKVFLQLEKLDTQEVAVVRMWYGLDGEPMTPCEIGHRLGITQECVRQIESEAVSKINRLLCTE